MNPPIVILGGAGCVWSDLEDFLDLIGPKEYHVAAVNDAATIYEEDLKFMASLHPEKVEKWLLNRCRNIGGDFSFPVVCHKGAQGFRPDLVVQELWSGSSGLYAAQVAVRHFHYERVVCCGIPMDPTLGHFFRLNAPWVEATKYQRGWREASSDPTMKGRVRSMSGWTSGLLGKPTAEWLSATEAVPHKIP